MSPRLPPNDRLLHADEITADVKLVQSLLREQFPAWADLRIHEYRSVGTDNYLFRLGRDLVVRLPRIASAAAQVHKQHQWLPRLAPHLPLKVPMPLGIGRPSAMFPWHWSVFRWLEGQPATREQLANATGAAVQLGRFVGALQALPIEDGPPPGVHNAFRGSPLLTRDAATRAAIESLSASVNAEVAYSVWERALAASTLECAPVWMHGDLLPGNMLLDKDGIHAVIDFGLLGVADPACDLMAAWTLFDGQARARFRETVAANDAAWSRGRGWALYFAATALQYYQPKKHPLAVIAAQTIDAVLSDPVD